MKLRSLSAVWYTMKDDWRRKRKAAVASRDPIGDQTNVPSKTFSGIFLRNTWGLV